MKPRAPFNPAAETETAIARAFRALADIGLQIARADQIAQYAPPKPARNRPAKPRAPKHGLSIPERDWLILRDMAESAVWLERGGLAIREQSDYQTGGEVIGRTQWVGMPQWARGFGMNRDAIRNAVERAIRGDRLGKKQKLLIQTMLEEINGS